MGQRRLIYFPSRGAPSPGEVARLRAEPVSFTTSDGLTLSGWFVPAPGPPQGPGENARFTVIVFNGNAGDRGMRAPIAAALAPYGIATLLMDYRGYADNRGSPSEEGLALDARAARAYVAGRPGVDPARIVYFGESLGTGVAVRLATEQRPAALILRSPFTSLVDVGRYHYPLLPVRWLLKDRFDSLDRIRRIGCPLLVIAGDRDRIVPPDLSNRLFAAAGEPKRLVTIEGADHNDEELLAGRRMITAILDFLRH
jgi:fermentation-respiration switch protein FrsA (DUF1100 family)